jgi:hypothetical protein
MFKDNSGSFAQIKLSKIPKVTYNDFLRVLKTACSAIGLSIPDKVIKVSGRWKSQAFERYIDQEMNDLTPSSSFYQTDGGEPLLALYKKALLRLVRDKSDCVKGLGKFSSKIIDTAQQPFNRLSKSVSPITASR